ncbi:MFS transporter [Pseudoclavibacter sp. 8L]|uniref:MFS transporter n=1 Tax=Pseudoclavibacter sp. 8L TaxID=2653162 RepID=UPI0012F1E05A|nr:MFS transporter [Pseudoclavibacter sp. 8L]VXB04381.1 MFS transporter [Pseudoclavibacter sp. 8L]
MAGANGSKWPWIIIHAVLVQVLTYAVRPGLSFAVLEAGGQEAVIGLLATSFALPALLLALPAGRLTDGRGERTIALLGSVLLIAAIGIALVSVQSVSGLMIAALVLGVGHLLSIISEQTAVANRSKSGSRESAFGLYTLSASIGQALGPLLLAVPSPSGPGPNLPLVFGSAMVAAVLLSIASVFLGSSSRGETTSKRPGSLASSRRILQAPGAFRAVVAGGIAIASVDVTLAFWPALSTQPGVSAALVSLMLTSRALATLASRAALPALSRRLSRRLLLLISLGVAAVTLALTGLPIGPIWLVISAVLYGFAIGVTQPITMAWLTDVAPVDQRGLALSLRLVGNRLAQSVIPAGAGLLTPITGGGGVLVAIGGSLAAAAAVAYSQRKRE